MSLEKFADMIYDDLTRDDEKICPNCENTYSEDDIMLVPYPHYVCPTCDEWIKAF